MMEYRENSLTYKEYIELRSSVGWNNFAKDQVIKAVNNGLYSVTVIENDAIIGMGRLIGDELRLIIRNNGTGMSSVNIGKIGWLLELILENKNNMVPISFRYTLELCNYEWCYR
mgnify:CR=1 FL=1